MQSIDKKVIKKNPKKKKRKKKGQKGCGHLTPQ